MKAVQVVGDKGNNKITVHDCIAKPTPLGRHILIQVHAAGITADELTWPELYDTPNQIPGHDISGVVKGVGSDYDGSIAIGDEVFAMLDAGGGRGGQAEYVVVTADEISRKPSSITHAEAAALPIPILTAWEAIFEHAKMKKGARVLITGASGAVGAMMVQLASKLLDVEVIALASFHKHIYVKSLGAKLVLDYTSSAWEESAQDMDVVLDTVGGSTLDRTWKCLKKDGTIVTVADPPPPWAFGRGKPKELLTHCDAKWAYFIVSTNGDILAKAAAFLENGTLKPLSVEAFPVDNAIEAWQRSSHRQRKGKVVIEFVEAR